MNPLKLVRDSFDAVLRDIRGEPLPDHEDGTNGSSDLRNEPVGDAFPTVPETADAAERSAETAAEITGDDRLEQYDVLAGVIERLATRCSDDADTCETEPSAETADDPSGVDADPAEQPLPSSEVLERLDAIAIEQANLGQLFQSRIHSDDVQSRAFEKLHGELEATRNRLRRTELMPLLKDVIECHDVLERQLEAMEEPACREPLERVGQMLLDLLFKYDVEPYRGEEEAFDRRSQQCVGTEPTEDESLDKHIARRGLCGFRTDEAIVRREQVTVFKHQPENPV